MDAALAGWASGAAPVTTFRVTVIQPALLLAQAGSRTSVRQLLFAVHAHCVAQGVEFRVWCNEGS